MPYLKLIFFFFSFGLLLSSLQCPESCLFHHVKPFITLSQHVLGYWNFCHLCSKCCIPVILSEVFANLKVTLSMYNQRSLPTRLDHFVFFNQCVSLIDFCGADVLRKVGRPCASAQFFNFFSSDESKKNLKRAETGLRHCGPWVFDESPASSRWIYP